MVDASTFVQVRTTVEAGAVPRLAFGRGLLVTTNSRLHAGGTGKMRLFDSIADANEAVGSDSDAAAAAAIWFGADPAPQGLYVGRWASADVPTTLTGAAVTASAGSPPLDAANASFVLNGVEVSVDLSSAATYAAIATAVQTAIQAAGTSTPFSGWTFTFDTDRFVLTVDGSDTITGGALTDTADAADTDIAAALGMAATSDAVYVVGHDAETIGDAVDEMFGVATGAMPVYVMLAADVPDAVATADTRTTLAAHAQASGDYVFGLLDTADQALVTGNTTSHNALALAAQQDKVAAAYGPAGQKPDVGLMALMSGQNFDLPASIISAHGKTMPGVTGADLTGAQLTELERTRTNTYAVVGDTPRALGSYTSRNGYWLDAVVWLLWLRSAVEARVWNTLTASRRYTNGLLFDDLTRILELGVRNGGIQPGGTVSAATKADIRAATGNQDFDGVLTAGYLIHINPLDQADRDNRVARFTVWLVGSEAIHRVFGDIRFTN